MRRSDLNLYLDALLAFVVDQSNTEQARRELVEIALEAEDFNSLLSAWLWNQKKGLDAALYVKLWFGLRYQDLGELYGLSDREISQVLRSQRIGILGSYPPLDQEKREVAGISCFMLEQRMSEWVDSEFEDLSSLPNLRQHFEGCSFCKNRLASYRKLQTQILESRKLQTPVSAEEWSQVEKEMRQRAFRERFKLISMALMVVVLSAAAIWIYTRTESKMPNVYEIHSD